MRVPRLLRPAPLAVCAALAFACLASVACSSHPDTASTSDGGDAGPAPPVPLPDPGDGGVEWNGWAGDFVRAYCVQCHNPAAPCSGSGCHPTNGDLPDFRLRDTVVSFAPTMRCGVAVAQDPAWNCGATRSEQFPVEQGGNPLPTDDQRALFVEWVDAGCP